MEKIGLIEIVRRTKLFVKQYSSKYKITIDNKLFEKLKDFGNSNNIKQVSINSNLYSIKLDIYLNQTFILKIDDYNKKYFDNKTPGNYYIKIIHIYYNFYFFIFCDELDMKNFLKIKRYCFDIDDNNPVILGSIYYPYIIENQNIVNFSDFNNQIKIESNFDENENIKTNNFCIFEVFNYYYSINIGELISLQEFIKSKKEHNLNTICKEYFQNTKNPILFKNSKHLLELQNYLVNYKNN